MGSKIKRSHILVALCAAGAVACDAGSGIDESSVRQAAKGGHGGGGGGATLIGPSELHADAVGQGADGAEVQLVWKDNSTNEDGFEIERSDDNGSSFHVIAETASDGYWGYWSDMFGPGAQGSYIYRVRAFQGGKGKQRNYSDYSNWDQASLDCPDGYGLDGSGNCAPSCGLAINLAGTSVASGCSLDACPLGERTLHSYDCGACCATCGPAPHYQIDSNTGACLPSCGTLLTQSGYDGTQGLCINDSGVCPEGTNLGTTWDCQACCAR